MKPARLTRVAVTGLGALTPAGEGLAACRAWEHAPGAYGPRVPDFDAARYVPSPKLRRSMHRAFELVAAAAVVAMRAAAIEDARQLATAGIVPERAGIAAALADLSPLSADLLEVLGAMSEPIAWDQFAERSLHQLHPFRRLTLLANMATAHTSMLFGLQGPSFTFTSGAAAGVQAIAQAAWAIAEGDADLMLCHTATAGEQTFAASPPADAAGALVLEAWETAERRGAPILAELRPEPLRPTREPGLSPVPGFLTALLRLDSAPAGGEVRLSDLGAVLAEAGGRP